MKIIETAKAPKPVGPYSQAIAAGGFVFCSGQIPLDPVSGNLLGKTPAEQAVQVMKNIAAVLEAEGLSLRNIIKSTIFLTDLGAFAEVNQVYEKALEGHKPARSTIQVSALPKGAQVEIECIAVK